MEATKPSTFLSVLSAVRAVDNVVAIDRPYGMYQVCAEVNDVEYRKVQLDENFQFKAADLLAAADEHTKLIFLCSPNNPTGNRLCREEIITLLHSFEGLVILDEAYADFSNEASFLQQLDEFPNLIILQTFSKAWGCAGIRLGMAFASQEIINLLNKIKYPYNVNRLTQQEAIHMIEKHYQVQQWWNPCSTNVPVSCRNSRSLLAADVSILPMPISF